MKNMLSIIFLQWSASHGFPEPLKYSPDYSGRLSQEISPVSILKVDLLKTSLSPSEEVPSHSPSLYSSWVRSMLARNVSLKPNENEGHNTEEELPSDFFSDPGS